MSACLPRKNGSQAGRAKGCQFPPINVFLQCFRATAVAAHSGSGAVGVLRSPENGLAPAARPPPSQLLPLLTTNTSSPCSAACCCLFVPPPRLPRPLLSSLSPSAAPHDFDALRMCSFDSYYLFPPFLRFAVSLSTHFTTFIALSSCSIALL